MKMRYYWFQSTNLQCSVLNYKVLKNCELGKYNFFVNISHKIKKISKYIKYAITSLVDKSDKSLSFFFGISLPRAFSNSMMAQNVEKERLLLSIRICAWFVNMNVTRFEALKLSPHNEWTEWTKKHITHTLEQKPRQHPGAFSMVNIYK